MDPTPQQTSGLEVLSDAGLWAGLTPTELAQILEGLGGPASFLEVAAIPKDVYTDTINLVRMPMPPEGEAAPLTPVVKGKAQQFLRACLAKVGAAAGPVTVTTLSIQKGPKMANFVDSALDSEITVLTKPHLEKLFAAYREARGEFPAEEIEPTEEQISAVHQLINNGSPPYVDFSIFGPYGRRLIRKLTFISYHYNAPEGTWKRLELPGPPDFDSWWKSWLVLKCTFLLLGGFKPERLDLYGEHLRSFITKYGSECWFLVYQADIRMRGEHFERIRRKLQIDFDAHKPNDLGFDPKTPWDAVFAAAVKDRDFWDSEVRDKALMYLTKVSSYKQASDDGTSQMYHPRGQAHTPFQTKGQGHKRKAIQQGAPKGSKSKGMGSGKGYSSSPSNGTHDVCNNFNRGMCSEPCPNHRAHTCSKCGKGHMRDNCPSLSSSSKPQGKGGKGKGSKGKGK